MLSRCVVSIRHGDCRMRNGFCRGKYMFLFVAYQIQRAISIGWSPPPLAFQGLGHLVGFIALQRAVAIYSERTNPDISSPQLPREKRKKKKKAISGLIINTRSAPGRGSHDWTAVAIKVTWFSRANGQEAVLGRACRAQPY